MTRRIALSLVLLLALNAAAQKAPSAAPPAKPATAAAPKAGVAAGWKQVPIPPLPAFHPQQPKRIQLDNGLVIFLQEDHELPVIGGTISIRGGGAAVPPNKTGMMDIYASAWRLGGTDKMTGDQMDDFLEARAARISANAGMETTSLSWSCLKGDFHDVFGLMIDLLQAPAFREDKISLRKTQFNSEISRRNDDIDSITAREMAKLAYGPDNPYGRTPEYDTVASVTRADLLQYHRLHVYSNDMIIGVTGDFVAAQMEATLRQAFESWPKGPQEPPAKIEFRDPKPGVYFVDKSDVNQSAVRMFHLGIDKKNPDLFALDVMNQIFFSGGFSSRIMNEIRTRRGLAYEAGGALTSGYDHPGLFYISAGTKSPSTVETVEAIHTMLAGMDQHPATEEELKQAKDSLLNSFIFEVDSKQKVLSRSMTYEFFGYPPDFLERYRAGIEKVTLADVARVARKYVHPEQLALLVVGNAAEFGKPLATVGKVTTLDISIPPPGAASKPAEAAALKPANTPEAKALLAKVVEALGGSARLQQVKAVRRKLEALQKTPQGDLPLSVDQLVVYSGQVRMVYESPMGSMTQVFSPSGSFMSFGEQTQGLPTSALEEATRQIHRDAIYVAQHAGDEATRVTLGGSEKVGDTNGQALEIESAGAKVKWVVDPASGRLLSAESEQASPNGPVLAVTEYSNWKPVDGIMFAFSTRQKQNGQEASSAEVKEVQVNPAVDPKLFEKPAPKSP